jgi:hypothetical protein
MVEGQIWLDQYYPKIGACINSEDKENYGKTRSQIINLDVSKNNLEIGLDLVGFVQLQKLNISFNKLFSFVGTDIIHTIEEMDWSNNLFGCPCFFGKQLGVNAWPNVYKLKKFNFSSNGARGFTFDTPDLTHLDASNNLLTNLDLQSTKNLIELNCSNNPITNLSLAYSLNINSVDCLGMKFDKSVAVSSTLSTTTIFACSATSSLLPTETTICANNSILFGSTIGLATFSGMSTLGWLVLGLFFCYKHVWWRNVIPTPGS